MFSPIWGCPKSRNARNPECRNAGNQDLQILKPGMTISLKPVGVMQKQYFSTATYIILFRCEDYFV